MLLALFQRPYTRCRTGRLWSRNTFINNTWFCDVGRSKRLAQGCVPHTTPHIHTPLCPLSRCSSICSLYTFASHLLPQPQNQTPTLVTLRIGSPFLASIILATGVHGGLAQSTCSSTHSHRIPRSCPPQDYHSTIVYHPSRKWTFLLQNPSSSSALTSLVRYQETTKSHGCGEGMSWNGEGSLGP